MILDRGGVEWCVVKFWRSSEDGNRKFSPCRWYMISFWFLRRDICSFAIGIPMRFNSLSSMSTSNHHSRGSVRQIRDRYGTTMREVNVPPQLSFGYTSNGVCTPPTTSSALPPEPLRHQAESHSSCLHYNSNSDPIYISQRRFSWPTPPQTIPLDSE